MMTLFFAGVGTFLFGPVLLAFLLDGVSPGWIAVKRAESISASHHERNTLEATFTTELNNGRIDIAARDEKSLIGGYRDGFQLDRGSGPRRGTAN